MRIVVPFGFYGCGNIGDEATLHGFAQLLERSRVRAGVSVGSRNPAHTARTEPTFRYFRIDTRDPRRWWAKYWATAHAVVGGTPIGDILGDWPLSELTPLVRAIDRWQVPLAFIGVGIESLRQEKSRKIFSREIAPRVQHWSVRCDHDRQRLEDYGVATEAITVAADMAWLIEPVTLDFGREQLRRWKVAMDRPLIGVNLVNENNVFELQPAMRAAVANGLDRLIQTRGARVIFLANEVRDEACFDRAAALQVRAQMKHADQTFVPPNEYFSPRQMMSIIACCQLTLSMRYHFCLFSALQAVPFIAIQRSDKVADLCWDWAWTARLNPPSFSSEEMLEHASRLTSDGASSNEFLRTATRKMKDRALLNLAALNTLN